MNNIKKYLFAGLLPLGLLSSCGSNGDDTSAGNKDSLNTSHGKKDTVTFTIEGITQEQYCQQTTAMNYCAPHAENGWEMDSITDTELIKKHANLLQRKGNNLSITTKKGKQGFNNNHTPEGDAEDMVTYYVHAVTDRMVVLKMYAYESYEYTTVDLETGQSFSTWGEPVFYQNQMAIAGNTDLMAAFTNNGLQLYVFDGGQWQLQMEKIMDDWGPQDLYWVNEETVLSKKLSLTQTDSGEVYKTDYVKVILKKEKVD